VPGAFYVASAEFPIRFFTRIVESVKGMSRLAVSMKNRRPSEGTSSVDLGGEEFVRAFNDCRTELVSTLYYILGNRDDAQDVAQDAFIKCWRTRASLTDVRNMRGWIFRVGMNAAKDLQRNAWRRKAKMIGDGLPPEEVGAPSPSEILEEREEQARLRKALLELRPDEKEVFLLRQNGDLTFEEIADQRSVPVGTVKTQMRTALQKLRRVLQEPNAAKPLT
jgi:RNA polymerase sigma factor (sigma-70 family)